MIKNSFFRFKRGYTLIEVIAVVTIIGIALPSIFTIIYVIVREQAKILAITKTKNEGDYAFNVIDNLIRNSAVTIQTSSDPLNNSTNRCNDPATSPSYSPANGANFYVKDRYGNLTRLYTTVDGKIASDSSILNASSELTSSKMAVTNFSISCTTTSKFSSPVVSIGFKIQYNTVSARPEDTASLNYQTKIKIRNLSN